MDSESPGSLAPGDGHTSSLDFEDEAGEKSLAARRGTGAGLERLLEGSPELHRDLQEAQQHYEASLSASTRRVYRISWRDFEAYCSERGLQVLPARPAAVALYLTARALARHRGYLPRDARRRATPAPE